MQIAVKTLDGGDAGAVELSDAVFGCEARTDILHRVITWQLANRRAYARAARERSDVARTGKKFGKQKGGGTARHGNRAAPQFVGGGKAHGPRATLATARARAEAAAADRSRIAAEAAARAETARLHASPARIWVQVATGASPTGLSFDCRRLARAYPALFEGRSCSSADWNRTRRLVVGPFRNNDAARAWEHDFRHAGGNGFVWTSDAGEEVTPVGHR